MIQIYDNNNDRLSQEFIDFIKKEGVPDDLLPYYSDRSNFRYKYDWNIIGGEEVRELFDLHYYPFDSKQLRPSNERFAVTIWLNRISTKIFEPEHMIRAKNATDRVQLRIAVSLIDKLPISKSMIEIIFDHMIYTYWTRKRAYDTFLCKEVMKLPFAPDYGLPF